MSREKRGYELLEESLEPSYGSYIPHRLPLCTYFPFVIEFTEIHIRMIYFSLFRFIESCNDERSNIKYELLSVCYFRFINSTLCGIFNKLFMEVESIILFRLFILRVISTFKNLIF